MKKLLKTTLTLSIAIALMSFMFKSDSISDWQRLGSRIVNMKADHDVIPVTVFKGAFTKLKFKVKGAPIHIHNIRVIFGNGESMNLKIGKKFAAGSESRVLDLPGNKRIIKKINLNYKSVPVGKGRAEIVAWGKH
ncbi:MAG: hypothetical protein JKY54_19855 [Flavobacteriales bacterium]|nr:hypothetical protein [Flavobacteriales bacterium]